MEKEKIFVICSVRGATEQYRNKLDAYVLNLEELGHVVHLPHRDTNQNSTGLNICRENMDAISKAKKVHIYYNSESQGTHFDMGVAFALNKKIVVVENETFGSGKSYPRMLSEWEKS